MAPKVKDIPVIDIQDTGSDSDSNASPVAAEVKAGGIPGIDNYHWSYTEEPHATRRKQILAKYPQVKKLFGPDPRLPLVSSLLLLIQGFMAYYSPSLSWPAFVLAAYVIGGTCNHMLMLTLHECAHNLAFKSFYWNRVFSLIANTPIGIPAAISFKRYHLEHHRYQGEVGIDVDVPTEIEGRIFQNTFTKFFFVAFQVCFYAIRPLMISPKKPGPWEFANFAVCAAFDTAVFFLCGPKGLFYLLLGTLLGTGLHPVAGHFISEHYVFDESAETYSYYGFFNIFAHNVGYHNEHHDFPYISGYRLPQLRAMAPEFYDNLPRHDCWITCLYRFITDPKITGFSRVKRQTVDMSKIKSE